MNSSRWKKGNPAPPTAWRKGNLPAHTVAIGTEYSRPDGIVRKVNHGPVRSRRWVFVHILNWIEANGPIPPGMKLLCLGDRHNTAPSNWRLIPKGLIFAIYKRFPAGIAAAPPELQETILATALLEYELNKHKR